MVEVESPVEGASSEQSSSGRIHPWNLAQVAQCLAFDVIYDAAAVVQVY